ncbi:MAG: glycosyl transferase family protein [Chloroflexi bacterium]|nr:glycosyl transferase family protein [Chloroflexota bacterium]
MAYAMSDHSGHEPVTVVVATRNRGQGIVASIASILSIDYPAFELLVIDQSTDDRTRAAVCQFRHDPRFRYLRSASKGLGRAHNLAIAQARSEIIAVTDDDCLVPPNWLSAIVSAFSADPRVGGIFGTVLACEYDVTAGYVPIFERARPVTLTRLEDNLAAGLGIGACFALRRSIWREVHGFDEMLGPGSPLGSLEDRDMALRILLAGYHVSYTPTVQVVHYGFRRNNQLRQLARRDWFGFGSSFAKYLKCGHWALTPYMLREMWIGQAVHQAIHHWRIERRIGRLTPIASFWCGFAAGLMVPVDRRTGLFIMIGKTRRQAKTSRQ